MSNKLDKVKMGQSVAVIKKFESKLNARFIEDYQINVFTEKLKVYDLIDSFGHEQVHKMVDYYFHIELNPDWNHFLKNSTKIRRAMLDQIQDKATRKLLAQQAREWINK